MHLRFLRQTKINYLLFIPFLSFLVILPLTSSASELDNPSNEWVFFSGWETATGTSTNAVEDGGAWNDHKHENNRETTSDFKVISNPPAGAPEPGNALMITWRQHDAGNCSEGSNSFVELFPSLPNPYYARVYFYSEDPREYSGCGGRKFMYFKNSGGHSTIALYLYDAGGSNVRLHIKNHVYDDGYNTSRSYHLDGDYNWPGKESEGIIEPNKWYSIEYAHYRHNSNGWLKAWVNGKLVINASKEAWGVGSYDTDTGYTTNWLQIPSYRNGGALTTHNEYIDNFVISSSYIGPINGIPFSDNNNVPSAPNNLRIIGNQ